MSLSSLSLQVGRKPRSRRGHQQALLALLGIYPQQRWVDEKHALAMIARKRWLLR